ncbi:MAG TPA: hypothetical protein VKA55_06160 [Gammaproteobacteria bacterium]|nr:hypothetical protein [Gammaproteobacteria bacterium]
MAITPLHARLPLEWPAAGPDPLPQGANSLRAVLAIMRGEPATALVPNGRLDPVAIPRLPHITARGRLALLDRLYAGAAPTDPLVIDRFIDAYLLLATRGFLQIPGLSTRRRALAKATLRAVELMHLLFRDTWHRQEAIPAGWWHRFLETFRAAGEARLFTIRRPLLRARKDTTVQDAARGILLQAAANPFAWEPELVPALERLLDLLASQVLLFPAASPSAYAEGRPGRFLFDAAGDQAPIPPEGIPPAAAPGRPRRWWILDATRVLARLSEFRRHLALGVSPERVHRLLADIPEPSRGILLRRLERLLSRPERRTRGTGGGQTHLISGLEQTVRHGFARRWGGTGDITTLDTQVRLQSEFGTRGGGPSPLRPWRIVDRTPCGVHLAGPTPAGPPLVGHVAGLFFNGAEQAGSGEDFRAAIIRWQRSLPDEDEAEVGVETFPGLPEDCWCRMVRGPGSTLHEYPALLLPSCGDDGPSLLLPPGLFQPGGVITLRTDDRDQSAELARLLEMGVHFERVEIRLQSS